MYRTGKNLNTIEYKIYLTQYPDTAGIAWWIVFAVLTVAAIYVGKSCRLVGNSSTMPNQIGASKNNEDGSDNQVSGPRNDFIKTSPGTQATLAGVENIMNVILGSNGRRSLMRGSLIWSTHCSQTISRPSDLTRTREHNTKENQNEKASYRSRP